MQRAVVGRDFPCNGVGCSYRVAIEKEASPHWGGDENSCMNRPKLFRKVYKKHDKYLTVDGASSKNILAEKIETSIWRHVLNLGRLEQPCTQHGKCDVGRTTQTPSILTH